MSGFQPLESDPALAKEGSVAEAITIDSDDCDATMWFVTSKSMRSRSFAWIWAYQSFWPGSDVRQLDPGRADLFGFQNPGLKPHVGHLDFLLIGPSRFLRGIDLLEIAVDRKPDIGLADRRAGCLHVVDLDDERCRHRVAEQVVDGPIGTGELP